MDNPLYPEGESPIILTVLTTMIGASIIPVAFAPRSYTATIASGPYGLLYSLGNYLSSQASAITGLGVTGLKAGVKYAWILLFLALTFQGSVILNSYDNQVYQKVDKGMTKYVLPAYRNTGLPIAKGLNVAFDTGICWVDLALMARSVAITDSVKVLVNCSSQDWQEFVNKTFEFLANTLAIPVYFIQEDGKQAFQIAPAVYSLALAINSTQPSFRCMCDELDFMYDILFGVITDENLALGLDAAANSVVYYPLNITVQAIVEAFGQGSAAYICDQTNVTEKIQCVIHRPPYFIPLRESLCNFTDYSALFIENTVDIVISQFLDYDGHLLVFNKILSAGVCLPLHFLVDLLDLLSRIDMVFDSQVQYMRHWAFDELINVAYRYATGLGEFFFAFNNYYTDQVGTIFENIFILLANALNTFKAFAVAVFYTIFDTGSVIAYFQTFNSTQFSVPYYNIKGATFNLTDAINEEFSVFVMTSFTTIEDIFRLLYNIVVLLAQDPSIDDIENFLLDDMPPMTDRIAIDIHAIYVTFANFIRQFDDTCMSSPYDPPIIEPLDVDNPNTICQWADIYETIGQFIRSVWIQLTTTIYQLEYNIIHDIPITGYAPFLQEYSVWLHGDMQIIYTNTIDSIGAFIGSWFQSVQCPCVNAQCSTGNEGITSTNVRDNIRLLIEALLDATIGNFFHGLVFFVDAMYSAVNLIGTPDPDLAHLLCVIVEGFIDFIGRFANIFKTFGDFVDCLLGTNGFHINLFGGTIYYVLFDTANSGSARNQICSVINVAIQAVQFVFGIITGGFTYLGQLIAEGATTVANDVVGLINGVLDQLNANVITKINDAINSVLGGLRSIVCFVNRIVNIFACLKNISISIGTYELPINIPGYHINGLHVDVGLFAFDIPGFDLKIPSFNVPLPLPDVSSITGAISCLTSNFNNFNGAGCANTCGPTGISGGIYPSFCTGSIVIPQVPDIPPVPSPTNTKRNIVEQRFEKRQIYYNDSTEIPLSNDTIVNDVFQNYTMVFCGTYYNISVDETLSESLRSYFAQQFIQCSVSTQLMFSINYMIFSNDTDDWLSPLTLTSAGSAIKSGLTLASKLYWPLANEATCYGRYFESQLNFNQSIVMTDSCMNWTEYYQEHNLTSKFSYRVGEFLQLIRENLEEKWANSSTYGFSNLLSTAWNTLSSVYNMAFTQQPGVEMSIYDSLWASISAVNNTMAQNVTVKRFITDHVYPVMNISDNLHRRFRPSLVFNNTKKAVGEIYKNMTEKMTEFMRPKKLKTQRNREVLSYMYHVVSSVYKEYSYRHKVFRNEETEENYLKQRNLDMLYTVVKTDMSQIKTVDDAYNAWKHATPLGRDKLKDMMDAHVDISRGKRLSFPPNFFGNGSEICGIPVPGGGSTCINCTILKVLLDDFVSRVVECVAISQDNLNILNNRYFKPFIQLIPNPFSRMNHQTSGIFESWVNEHLNENFTRLVSGYQSARFNENTGQNGPNFGFIVTPTETIGDLLDGWVKDLAAGVLDIDFSFKDILTQIKNYLITETQTIGNSLYDWIDNFVSIPVTMNCERLSERGIGIGNLLLSASLVTLFMVAIIAILARVNSTLLMTFTPVILMWPLIVVVVNYGVSPLQLPAVPFCIGDDIFEILTMGDIQCIPVSSVLNITSSQCPGADSDYERTFSKCSETPYYFNNPWRSLFFALDYVWPSFMNALRSGNNVVFSWIRSINGMQEMMTFGYPAGQPTSDYTGCFASRIYNIATFAPYIGAASVVSGAAGLSAVIIIAFVGSFTYALGLTCMWIGMLITGYMGGASNEIITNPEMWLVENLKGSREFNGIDISEVEQRTGVTFSESNKKYILQRYQTKRHALEYLKSHVADRKQKMN